MINSLYLIKVFFLLFFVLLDKEVKEIFSDVQVKGEGFKKGEGNIKKY